MANEWKPNTEETKYMNMLLTMCTESLIDKGYRVKKRKTFTDNVRRVADSMDGLPQTGVKGS